MSTVLHPRRLCSFGNRTKQTGELLCTSIRQGYQLRVSAKRLIALDWGTISGPFKCCNSNVQMEIQ